MESEFFEIGRRARDSRAEGSVPFAIIHPFHRPLQEGPTGRPRPCFQAEIPRPRRGRSGFTLVELLVALAAAAIVVALVIPAWSSARRWGKVTACMDNLRRLHRAEAAWEKARPGEAPGVGKAYWLKLVRTDPPLADRKALACPLAPHAEGPDDCSYWGPAGDVAKVDAADPVGCDEESNHDERRREGGNVLRKSGEVVNDRGEFWGSALRGKCRP